MPTAPVPPRRVGVVGAGMAGLCTAWFLQEQGIGVTVLERTAVAAGASAGNAGWITPALVAPLPDPVILREGLPALLAGVDPGARQDEWVGARPCTPDGLPVIGRTRSARIFVAGGHGMWGITLGPVTGRLLAGLVTGRPAPELRPFDPLR